MKYYAAMNTESGDPNYDNAYADSRDDDLLYDEWDDIDDDVIDDDVIDDDVIDDDVIDDDVIDED